MLATLMQMPGAVAFYAELQQLGKELDGTLTINDPGIPSTPPVWNELLKGDTPVLPRAIPVCYVTCASRSDVGKCVAFAVRHKLKLHAKGTGHHYGGTCLADGGMVLDLSQLKRITVNPQARTATIEPGVTTRELREATIQHGLHFPGGHISDVGCSGFVLGGGNGWGATQYGAAVDNVLSFTCVLPQPPGPEAHTPETQEAVQGGGGQDQGQEQGQGHATCPEVVVDEASDPDLFAGLKGAGQFLAIVVEFQLRLHPVELQLPVISALYPVSEAQEVVALYLELMASGIQCLAPSVSFSQGAEEPHAPLVSLAVTGFAPKSDPGVCSAFDKVRALLPAARVSLSDETLPYLQALAMFDSGWTWPGLCLYGHGMFIERDAFTADLAHGLMSATESMTSHKSLILVCPATPVTPQPNSLDFRGGIFICAYSMWPRSPSGPAEDGDEAHAAWVHGVEEVVGQACVGLYVNEVMLNRPGQLARCYKPATLERLTKLKAATDPLGILRYLE